MHNNWLDDVAGNGEVVINFYGRGKVEFEKKSHLIHIKEVYSVVTSINCMPE